MTIYYTHKYKELGSKSHELLEVAIADYIGNRIRAGELVAEMRRETGHGYDGKPRSEEAHV